MVREAVSVYILYSAGLGYVQVMLSPARAQLHDNKHSQTHTRAVAHK